MEHFTKRLSACIIDYVVVFLLIAIVNNILYIPISLMKVPFLSAYYPYITTIIITLAYFTIMEAKTNKTIGKMMMNLYVSDEEGYLSYFSAFVRNITKCFWILLIPDVLIGLILNFPSRLFDKIAGTDVYADEELEVYDENDVDEHDSTKGIDEKISAGKDTNIESKSAKTTDKSKLPVNDVQPAEEAKNDTLDIGEDIGQDIEEKTIKEAKKEVKAETKPVPKKEAKVETKKVPKKETEKAVQKSETDEAEFIFADDSDIHSTYDKKLKAKKDAKVNKAKNAKENADKIIELEELNEESDMKLEETPYEDEILDLIIEEEESDSFVELTKDDF
ncbi:MAG: RDD family protein [Methanosphaera sp.]|nr:RDD family protein [Methanosphaera sp.]